jgi:hypothetical protein
MIETTAGAAGPLPRPAVFKIEGASPRKEHPMTDLRELDVVELGQIEGGEGLVCTPVIICDPGGKNCQGKLICVPKPDPPPPPPPTPM